METGSELVSFLQRTRKYYFIINIVLPLVFVSSVIIIIYYKYFYGKLIRKVSTSLMIYLEPENQEFCDKIGSFFKEYKVAENDKIEYDSDITDNLYFYLENKTIDDNFKSADKILTDLNVKIVYEEDKYDSYVEEVGKFVNTRFDWSSSDKLEGDKKTLLVKNNEFFENIKKITESQEEFDEFLENKSLTNFIDFENMSIESFFDNKLIKKYGMYLNKPLLEYINEIKEKYNNENLKSLNVLIEDSEIDISVVKEIPVNDLMDDFIKRFKAIFFKKYDIDDPFYNKYFCEEVVEEEEEEGKKDVKDVKDKPKVKKIVVDEEEDDINDTRYYISKYNCLEECVEEEEECEEICKSQESCEITKEDNIDNVKHEINRKVCFDKEVEKEEFEKYVTFIKYLEEIKETYKNTTDMKELIAKFNEYYFNIENTIHNTFKVNQSNVISSIELNVFSNIFQNIMDCLLLQKYYTPIELAVKFTLHFLLEDNKLKEEKLEELMSLYVRIQEMYMFENFYRKRLDSYNFSRKPNIDKLKEMYQRQLDKYYNFFITKKIKEPWKDLSKLRPPEHYSWVLEPMRQKVLNSSPNKMKDMLFGGEFFTEHDYKKEKNDEDDVIEHFGNPFGAITKPFKAIASVFKKIAEFLVDGLKLVLLFIKLFKYIFDPLKLVGLLAKFAFLILLIMLWILYRIRLKKNKDPKKSFYLGELIYFPIMVFLSAISLTLYALSVVLTIIVKYFDTEIPLIEGGIYRFFYWGFGATENSPGAWYKSTGYHYKNIVERMFFAFGKCSDNYKPDKKTNRTMCTRKLSTEPAYCLKSNIYRVKENLNPKTPYIPGSFFPSMEFLDSVKSRRRKIITDYKKMKTNFHDHCSSSMEKYDSLTKNVCRLYPEIIADSKLSTMENLCFNAYCTNGNREPFCFKMSKDHNFLNNINTNINVVPRFIVISIYVIVLTFIINAFLNS